MKDLVAVGVKPEDFKYCAQALAVRPFCTEDQQLIFELLFVGMSPNELQVCMEAMLVRSD